MPFFTFLCPDCSKVFEELVAADTVPPCPGCGGTASGKQLARLAPDGRMKAVAKAWRTQAAREGHLSNYSRAERGTL